MLFDETVVDALGNALPEWLAVVLLLAGFLGSVYVVVPGTVLAAVSKSGDWTTWAVTVCCAYGVFVFLKPVVELDRPPVQPPLAPDVLPAVLEPVYHLGLAFDSGSFPSGHALVATVFWGLFVLETDLRSLPSRAVVAATVVIVVAGSRVALGVHYPGDVLAGILLGVAVLGVSLSLRRRFTKPTPPLLVLATLPAVGSILTGRPGDGLVLLGVVCCLGATYAWQTRKWARRIGTERGSYGRS